jgi:hypothetical protein
MERGRVQVVLKGAHVVDTLRRQSTGSVADLAYLGTYGVCAPDRPPFLYFVSRTIDNTILTETNHAGC